MNSKILAILLVFLFAFNTATPVVKYSPDFDFFIHAFFDTLGFDQLDDVAYLIGGRIYQIEGLFKDFWNQINKEISIVGTSNAISKLGKILKFGAGTIKDVATNKKFLEQYRNITIDIQSSISDPSAFFNKVSENAKANIIQLTWVFNDLRLNWGNEKWDAVGRRLADLIIILTKDAFPKVSSNLRLQSFNETDGLLLNSNESGFDVLLCINDAATLFNKIFSYVSQEKEMNSNELTSIYKELQNGLVHCSQ